jgi:hypothetical protein
MKAISEPRSVEDNAVAVHFKKKSRQQLDRREKPTNPVQATVFKFFSEYFGSTLSIPTPPTLHINSSTDQCMDNEPTVRRPLILIAEDSFRSHANPG